MAILSLQHIYKIYEDGCQAVKDVCLEVNPRESIVFVGPVGSGKSTILRMILGSETISKGELYISGKRMNEVDPKQRGVAAICGNYAMYQGQSVYENLAFNLKLNGVSENDIKARVENAAGILEMEDILTEDSGTISERQKQKIALGRAAVKNPEIYLFDEPSQGLDTELRKQMKTGIMKFHQKSGKTMLYATENLTDAMEIGDRIIILKDGAIQQVGTPDSLFKHPANAFVEEYIRSFL